MPIKRRAVVPSVLTALRLHIDTTSECHRWLRGHNGKNRPVTYITGEWDYVYRVIWEELHGPIPSGLQICHSCDHEWCVNPAHFFLGTQADNMADKAAKGRVRGVRHPNTHFTEQDIRDILQSTQTHQALADMYGVSRPTITMIKLRRTWSHIGG